MEVVLIPLEENYKTKVVHVTELENYFACPYKHNVEPKVRDKQYLFFGTFTHNIVLPFLLKMNWDAEHDMKIKYQMLDLVALYNYDRSKRIDRYLDLMRRQYKDKNFLFTELSMKVDVHLGQYKIVIKGTPDAIFLEDQKYGIVDLKTAKQIRKDSVLWNKIQKYFYSWMLNMMVPDQVSWFEYAILTKHKLIKNIELQRIYMWFDNQSISRFCTELLYLYAESLETNVRTTIQGDACRYCKLWPKQMKACPIYTKKDF